MLKTAIEARFRDNARRVSNVVELYNDLIRGRTGKGKGRPSVREADLLRAAVVLLHATLEDLLRSLAEWKVPSAKAEVLDKIPLVGKKDQHKPTSTLGDLAAHRGSTVEEVIRRSVVGWLGRSNYNNLGEVKRLLDDLGVDPKIVDPFAVQLAALMSRRHLIVHRADRNESTGRGQHPARSINRTTVQEWVGAAVRFGDALLAEF